MPRPSQKFIVGLVDDNGQAVLDVADIGKLQEGDEIEFVSGSLDVTIAFAGAQIFGQDKYRLPPDVNSKSLKVLDTAPQSIQEPYSITDEESGDTFRRAGQPAAQPVMIFGP